ncbi:HtaA domain-containing protein [Aeromicrobium duanguangcaii]|uniref:HtaA domain-containing protein n=1 Tax=Aeromicrobium duanguangcaii TaxID=2968086 RepID=UPI002017A7DB|nr:HtaA domain-containing protein [Aeromicrobium duanguangcaii]MCL3838671.1 HtaA domain-containing protein [Aeromicrobium duanguangcaii]
MRSLFAVVLAAALCFVAVPTMRADAAAEPSTPVTGGTISWGVKESFRSYLGSPFAGGEVTPSGPATDDGTQTTFPQASGAWGSGASFEAKGAVRFTAHAGVLDFTLASPRLEVDGNKAKLFFDVTVKNDAAKSVHFADVDLSGHQEVQGTTVRISGAPTTLTAGGAGVLGAQYEEGQAVDGFDASLQLAAAPTPEPTPEPTTEPTPEPTTEPTPEPTTEPTPEPTPGPQEPVSDRVTGGTISWGIKSSYRGYVGMLADGSITTTAPATLDGGRFVFRQPSGTWAKNTVDAGAKGVVRFRGHYEGDHYAMNLTLSSPRIVFTTGGGGKVVMDAINSEGETLKGVTVATLDLKGRVTTAKGKVTITDAPATLSVAGNKLFAYRGSPFYKPGDALDPVSATFDVENAVGLDFGSTPTKPSRPGGADQPAKPDSSKPAKPAKPGVDRERAAAKRGGKVGELSWGVKASWNTYVIGPIAKGTVSVSGGATAAGGAYRFGQASTTATPPNATGTTSYRGAVSFYGHDGTLDRTVSQPSVRVTSPISAVLSANVSGMGRLDIATLNLSHARKSTETGWVRYAGAPATLTAAGTAVFAYKGRGFYPQGTVLDPVTFSVGTVAAARPAGGTTRVASANAKNEWTAPPAPPAAAGLVVEQDEIQAGDEVTASGPGFLPNETGIRVVLYSTPVVLADDVTADATGRATWTGTIPATVEPGKHTLTFQGSVDRGVVIDVAAADEIVGCKLTDGRLDWGFKESFRAYVSGAIANGDWTTRDGASYETPEFTWSKGAGVLDEKTRAGELGFGGAIEFTGHDGALDTVIENPVVRFTDEKAAVLTVDYTGGTMDAAVAGKNDSRTLTGVPFADLDLAAGDRTQQGDRVTISDIPATLTSAGSAAFSNYETGTALDPMTLSFTVSKDCGTAAATAADEEQAVVLDPEEFDTTSGTALPQWVPWVGGALLGALAAIGATVLIMRRREVKA